MQDAEASPPLAVVHLANFNVWKVIDVSEMS